MHTEDEIAKILLEIKAIRINRAQPFVWASGMHSPIYCDNRMLLSYPSKRNFVKKALINKSLEIERHEYIAGVATAGIAHAALMADALELPMIYVRSKAKSHGRKNQIEGRIEGTPRILVVEDLISTGGSSIKAVEAIRAAGGIVEHVLAIFSYGFAQADQNFDQAQCRYHTLCDYTTLLRVALEQDYIKAADIESLTQWKQDPTNWQ